MNGEESRVEFESGAGFSTKNVIEKIVADGASVIPAELTRISDAYLKVRTLFTLRIECEQLGLFFAY